MEMPLIGVPLQASLEECDLCGDTFSLSDVTLTGAQFLCASCKIGNKIDNRLGNF